MIQQVEITIQELRWSKKVGSNYYWRVKNEIERI